jgi:hypothetical protein
MLAIIKHLATLVAILWRKAPAGDDWSLCGILIFCWVGVSDDSIHTAHRCDKSGCMKSRLFVFELNINFYPYLYYPLGVNP